MESKTNSDMLNTKNTIELFQRNINNLKLHIDPLKREPVVFAENTENVPSYDEREECEKGCDDFISNYSTKNSTIQSLNVKEIQNNQALKNEDSLQNISENTVVKKPDTLNQKRKRKQKRKVYYKIERKWFILLAGCILVSMSFGIPLQLSVMYVEILDEFGRSNAETSLVQAVCSGVLFGGGFIAGMIVAKYGVQVAGTLAGIFSATGLSIGFFAMNIPYLVVTVGGFAGFGFSIANVCSTTSVGQHFLGKSKLLALSCVSFGSGVGSMSFLYIMEYSIQTYGWRGTLLILGGMTLNFIPAALLCVPPQKLNADKNVQIYKLDQKDSLQNATNIEAYTNVKSKNKNQIGNGLLKGLKNILKCKIFLLFIVGLTTTLSGLNALIIFLIDFYQSRGISRSQSVFIFFICNAVSAVSRFVPGFLKQIPHISVLAIPAIYALIGCVTTFIFPLTRTYWQILLVSCFYGIARGGIVATISLTTIRLVGVENFPIGIGVLLSTSSIGIISSGPISGKLRDISGSYDLSFYTVSGALGCAFVIFVITAIWRKRTQTDGNQDPMEIIVEPHRKKSSIVPWKKSFVFKHNE